MGWTYQEYMNQPRWFVESVIIKMNTDSKYRNVIRKKAERDGRTNSN